MVHIYKSQAQIFASHRSQPLKWNAGSGGRSDSGQFDSQGDDPGETSEPVTEAEGSEVGLRKPSDLPTAGMQGVRAGSIDSAAEGRRFRGRREVGGSNNRLGNSIWSVWVSEDDGSTEGRGVAGES